MTVETTNHTCEGGHLRCPPYPHMNHVGIVNAVMQADGTFVWVPPRPDWVSIADELAAALELEPQDDEPDLHAVVAAALDHYRAARGDR